MVDLSDSILDAQTRLATAVDRTISALRSGLRECESFATATAGDYRDALALQAMLTQYSRFLSEMKNFLTAQEDTADDIMNKLKR
jgi:hypothetical protein